MLLLATVTYVVCFAAWTLPGALAPLYREALRLSATQVGWLVATPVLTGALVRVPVGVLADRFGARRVLALLVAALVVPALTMGWSRTYAGLLVSGAALGLAGGAFAAGAQFVGSWFSPQRSGAALGIFGLGNLGAALSAWLGPPAATAWGPPAVYSTYAGALALTALVFFALARPPVSARSSSAGSALRALKAWGAWQLGFFFLVTFGGFLALSVHLSTVLVEVYELSPSSAGRHVAAFVLLGTLARPLGGLLSDGVGGVRVLYGVFPAITLLALVLAAEPAHLAGVTVILALGATLGVGNGAVTKLVAERFSAEIGSVSGLAGAVGSLGGLLLPVAQGLGQDLTGSYVFGFLVLAALALVGLGLHARPGTIRRRTTRA
jgi:NNP family nitrate/nitrite transporter-like MFS transporter